MVEHRDAVVHRTGLSFLDDFAGADPARLRTHPPKPRLTFKLAALAAAVLGASAFAAPAIIANATAVLGLSGPAASAAGATQYTFYASPTGTGSACSEASPCSLPGVQAKVRTVNANMSGDVVVYLRGGTYTLAQSWDFTQADSGSGGYRVIYAAYNGEKPVISGGQSVTGWQIYDTTKNIYRAYVGTSLQTRQLYVDGVRAQRARGPLNPSGFSYNSGYGFDTTDTSLQNLSHVDDLEIAALNEWKGPSVRRYLDRRNQDYDGPAVLDECPAAPGQVRSRILAGKCL